jgi:hypothetical protein
MRYQILLAAAVAPALLSCSSQDIGGDSHPQDRSSTIWSSCASKPPAACPACSDEGGPCDSEMGLPDCCSGKGLVCVTGGGLAYGTCKLETSLPTPPQPPETEPPSDPPPPLECPDPASTPCPAADGAGGACCARSEICDGHGHCSPVCPDGYLACAGASETLCCATATEACTVRAGTPECTTMEGPRCVGPRPTICGTSGCCAIGESCSPDDSQCCPENTYYSKKAGMCLTTGTVACDGYACLEGFDCCATGCCWHTVLEL